MYRLHMCGERMLYVCACVRACVRVSLSLSLTVYCLYTCAFPNELSSLPKARTLTRGSHSSARNACTRINTPEQGRRESKANIASGTPRAEVTLVLRYYAYYPAGAAIERKYPMCERDACTWMKKRKKENEFDQEHT